MSFDVAVLLSIGRHPASGRSRRADLDARALEVGLRLIERRAGVRLHPVHAGDPAEPALREYLGMGLPTLTVLDAAPGSDVASPLLTWLQELRPRLILAGTAAEAGHGSGSLAYVLAAGLGCAIAPAVVSLTPEQEGFALLQALPRGRRRQLEARAPLVATVDRAAPPPRASAFGPARRGQIIVRAAAAAPDPALAAWKQQPARPRPRRLRAASGGSAAERLRAASEMQAGRGQLLVSPPPDEAAEAIYRYLVEEGILPGSAR